MGNETVKRNGLGRFIKGSASPSPGRPSRQKEVTYLAVMNEVVSPDDWKRITERAVVDAKKGNPVARAWLAKYLIGDTPTIAAAIQAVQINPYPTDKQISESTLIGFAKLLASVSVALSDTQRKELDHHMQSILKLTAPTENDDAEPYTVDEHGVVEFQQSVRPYQQV